MIAFGIDIGTTTLRASAVAIEIGPFGKKQTQGVGTPHCVFTPYREGNLDEEAIVNTLKTWGQALPAPDAGTILFTGEAQRAPNAAALGQRLTQTWSAFFSAQLDPDWETRVAAQGAGAVALSAQRLGAKVVHFDVGGGTTNVAWIENGVIVDTACLDLGARKWIVDVHGKVLRKTKQAEMIEARLEKKITHFDVPTAQSTAEKIADWILGRTPVPSEFVVVDWKQARTLTKATIFSFSGGVVDCLTQKKAPFAYGDLGPALAAALIAGSKTLEKTIYLSKQKGSATAFGVSAFGFQVSGNSISAPDLNKLTNVPLFEEAEALSKPLPPVAAVRMSSLGEELTEMEARAAIWSKRLSELADPPQVLAFLLEKNLAKSFGYVLEKAAGKGTTRFVVLDELPLAPPEPGLPARTLDLAPTPDGQRFLVTIKSLRLF